jgi:hypothetical protein
MTRDLALSLAVRPGQGDRGLNRTSSFATPRAKDATRLARARSIHSVRWCLLAGVVALTSASCDRGVRFARSRRSSRGDFIERRPNRRLQQTNQVKRPFTARHRKRLSWPRKSRRPKMPSIRQAVLWQRSPSSMRLIRAVSVTSTGDEHSDR